MRRSWMRLAPGPPCFVLVQLFGRRPGALGSLLSSRAMRGRPSNVMPAEEPASRAAVGAYWLHRSGHALGRVPAAGWRLRKCRSAPSPRALVAALQLHGRENAGAPRCGGTADAVKGAGDFVLGGIGVEMLGAIFVYAVLLCLVYLRTQNIFLAIGFHALANFSIPLFAVAETLALPVDLSIVWAIPAALIVIAWPNLPFSTPAAPGQSAPPQETT